MNSPKWYAVRVVWKQAVTGAVGCGFLAALLLCAAEPALAAGKTKARGKAKTAPVAQPVQRAKAAEPAPDISTICIEAQSGLVISESNPDQPRPPASMVKMMLMLLVSEGLGNGSWTLETPISITKHAQGMGGTQVFLKEGENFPLGLLMNAVAVHSANDAAMAVAEGLWGSEEAYKKRMNERAAELGMAHSTFHSVHGLPPSKGEVPDQTTARDMARLGQFCVLNPTIMQWCGQKELQFRPESAVEYNTNKLLWSLDGCDGIKTGFTRSAGFCVTATVARDGIRLIAVVMGVPDNHDRFLRARQALEDGFAQVCKKRIVARGEAMGTAVPVANCETAQVRLVAADDLVVVVKREDVDKLEVAPELPSMVRAPVAAGASLGEGRVVLAGKALGSVPLVAPSDLAQAGWRWKLVHGVKPPARDVARPQ